MEFLSTLKELVRAYQAFEHYSARHIRSVGLTPTQFDLVATLGNQPPMTCGELGEKTLVTKGTLTGVLDRLEEKKLISRVKNEGDARSQKIALTPEGQKLFDRVFPEHVKHLDIAFKHVSAEDLKQIKVSIRALRLVFEEESSRT